jgi:nicotinamidase-related amidase
MNLIDKLEALDKAATPGPWGEISLEVRCGSYCQGGSGVLELSGYPKIINAKYDDLAFITEMRNNIGKLLAVARAAEAQVILLKQWSLRSYVTEAMKDALAALEQSE